MKIPNNLKKFQKSFLSIITMPFKCKGKSFFVQNARYNQDFLKLIESKKGISADEQVQFYNCDYWFRLLTIMQQDMPLMRHILGIDDFNHFAMTYLSNFSCRSEILNNLEDDLLIFMKQKHKWNTDILCQIAELEFAYIKAFDEKNKVPINIKNLTQKQQNNLSHYKFNLQKHCFLIYENWNLVQLHKMAKRCSDKIKLPKCEKQKNFWLIFRSQKNIIQTQSINIIQYQILKKIKHKNTLSDAIKKVTTSLNESELQILDKNISQWFSQWIQNKIFYIDDTN